MASELSRAECDIIAERRRQISVEGFTAAHDDEHRDGELARAGACYALWSLDRRAGVLDAISTFWPFELKWWKPKNSRQDLVAAAAFLIAEIERIDRMEGNPA